MAIMRMWKAGISDDEGFTLLEFAIVIVILGIFLGLAYPRIQKQMAGDPLRESSTKLAEGIRRVRVFAISNGRLLRLRITLPRGELKVEATDAGGEWLEMSDSPIKKEALAEGVRLLKVRIRGDKDIDEGEAILNFLPSGETRGSLMYLAGGSDKVRTLIIHPFLNHVEIRDGRVSFQAS
ncbi:MAG: prepilin-type N-terminal cleavage/methylation domain-containing protein [Nitrospinaceae bacterium]|nr:prepilin-type N-terminal cleavage/methylation domain-containing protein [Nitrospinaceae bacterium]MBT3432851.1 prepilin-type N-terminal cleavage/methylation domain-containing protein [Nitrospinaceae bacterium]MBT3819909.1 prepilin-type N-terminal cleavage/methylation domain-containing protein [Nitrospinaceae bacterium]MBT4092818.1 prepilin-type N-terminal cleavage/methylation domain-containing protein [Nitrospinaceae bacterium]MBT4430457.1 prepilin-type N-terminal cleavage/methylation domain